MKILKTAVFLFMMVSITNTLFAQEPDGREVMEKFKAQELTEDESIDIQMRLIRSGGSVREREVSIITKTDKETNRKLLIRFHSPADIAGTGFLSIEYTGRDDDNWLYLPATRRARRIASQDKTDRFVGTEFTYEDFDSEDLDAFGYTLMGSETINGVDAWLIEAIPTDNGKIKETAYAKRELWISKEHSVMVQAKFYDQDGVIIKTLYADDIRQIPGTDKWRPYRMVMKDVQSGNKTELVMNDIKINQGIPDDYFSQRYLQRGR